MTVGHNQFIMSNSATEKKDTTDAQLKDLQTENKKLKDSLTKAEKDKTALNTRLAKLEPFEEQVKALQAENQTQNDRIEQLENDNANYKTQLETLNGDLGSATNELELLREQSANTASPSIGEAIKSGKFLIHHGAVINGVKYSKKQIADSKELKDYLFESKSTAISEVN